MPEMTDAMYCHQQICIPPTYPYLLRQYAKAAIRTQPTDLLRWSAAYFRALALGVPAPVKPRLEYPVLKTHYGLTPGWLKTLLRQFAGYEKVTWPQLYDRWHGACLEVKGLLEVISLGGFPDPGNIPWFRFVAVASGHLTKNLTSTMILLCELLTDEPEGGASTIPYGTFADLYRFLANLDAAEARICRNYYYTESNLDLGKKEEGEEAKSVASTVKLEQESMEEYGPHDMSDLERYLAAIDTGGEEEMKTSEESIVQLKKMEEGAKKKEPGAESDSQASCYVVLDPDTTYLCKEDHLLQMELDKSSSKDSGNFFGEATQLAAEAAAATKSPGSEEEVTDQVEEEEVVVVPSKVTSETIPSSALTHSEVSVRYSEVELVPVPGIGPRVDEELVQAALQYLGAMAERQQGLVMPRNIRHFLCPPLEECPQN